MVVSRPDPYRLFHAHVIVIGSGMVNMIGENSERADLVPLISAYAAEIKASSLPALRLQ